MERRATPLIAVIEMIPIVEAMRKYSAEIESVFCTPGHKQGLGAHEELKKLVTAEGLREEVSLSEIENFIPQAERLAAEVFGAEEIIFSVNGTTAAVQAMILSTVKPGDLVLVARNFHKSVMSGIILAGAIPIYLPVEFSQELKIPLNLFSETVAAAIKKYPTARALILTTPNYYGVAADIKKISELVHKKNILLLVDEAHGAHLKFDSRLPISAIEAGADLVAQSTHKTLGALTQSSMLLVKKSFADKARQVMRLLQTTSPNNLLLASLDLARLQVDSVSRAVDLSKKIRAEIKIFDSIKNFDLDLTKITVNVEDLNLTGYEAEKILREKLFVQCEMSDLSNLLFIISYADTEETISKLLAALKKLSAYKKISAEKIFVENPARKISIAKISPREIFFTESEYIEIKKSVGRICAQEITIYPPGIPIINIGEEITAEVVEYIEINKNLGGRVTGLENNFIKVVR